MLNWTPNEDSTYVDQTDPDLYPFKNSLLASLPQNYIVYIFCHYNKNNTIISNIIQKQKKKTLEAVTANIGAR